MSIIILVYILWETKLIAQIQRSFGRPGFATVLKRVAQFWRDNRAKLEAQGAEVMAALAEETRPQEGKACLPARFVEGISC